FPVETNFNLVPVHVPSLDSLEPDFTDSTIQLATKLLSHVILFSKKMNFSILQFLPTFLIHRLYFKHPLTILLKNFLLTTPPPLISSPLLHHHQTNILPLLQSPAYNPQHLTAPIQISTPTLTMISLQPVHTTHNHHHPHPRPPSHLLPPTLLHLTLLPL